MKAMGPLSHSLSNTNRVELVQYASDKKIVRPFIWNLNRQHPPHNTLSLWSIYILVYQTRSICSYNHGRPMNFPFIHRVDQTDQTNLSLYYYHFTVWLWTKLINGPKPQSMNEHHDDDWHAWDRHLIYLVLGIFCDKKDTKHTLVRMDMMM